MNTLQYLKENYPKLNLSEMAMEDLETSGLWRNHRGTWRTNSHQKSQGETLWIVANTSIRESVWKTLENIALEVFDIFDKVAPKYLVAASDYWLANFLWDNNWTLIPYDAFEIYDSESCEIPSQCIVQYTMSKKRGRNEMSTKEFQRQVGVNGQVNRNKNSISNLGASQGVPLKYTDLWRAIAEREAGNTPQRFPEHRHSRLSGSFVQPI